MPELTVVVPAYEEEENLRILLPRLLKTLCTLGITYEVLVVDTMQAMDNTKIVCEENGVHYINRERGNCYGDAIRTAIAKAQGNLILFMDGDGSHTPEYIPHLVENIVDNDVVIASRYVNGGTTDNPIVLILMSKVVNIFYSLILNLNCKDVSNSFKIYRAELLKPLKLKCDNFDIVEEILFKMKLNKSSLKIKEIPHTFKKRMFGNTKRNLFLFMFSYFVTLIKLRITK